MPDQTSEDKKKELEREVGESIEDEGRKLEVSFIPASKVEEAGSKTRESVRGFGTTARDVISGKTENTPEILDLTNVLERLGQKQHEAEKQIQDVEFELIQAQPETGNEYDVEQEAELSLKNFFDEEHRKIMIALLELRKNDEDKKEAITEALKQLDKVRDSTDRYFSHHEATIKFFKDDLEKLEATRDEARTIAARGIEKMRAIAESVGIGARDILTEDTTENAESQEANPSYHERFRLDSEVFLTTLESLRDRLDPAENAQLLEEMEDAILEVGRKKASTQTQLRTLNDRINREDAAEEKERMKTEAEALITQTMQELQTKVDEMEGKMPREQQDEEGVAAEPQPGERPRRTRELAANELETKERIQTTINDIYGEVDKVYTDFLAHIEKNSLLSKEDVDSIKQAVKVRQRFHSDNNAAHLEQVRNTFDTMQRAADPKERSKLFDEMLKKEISMRGDRGKLLSEAEKDLDRIRREHDLSVEDEVSEKKVMTSLQRSREEYFNSTQRLREAGLMGRKTGFFAAYGFGYKHGLNQMIKFAEHGRKGSGGEYSYAVSLTTGQRVSHRSWRQDVVGIELDSGSDNEGKREAYVANLMQAGRLKKAQAEMIFDMRVAQLKFEEEQRKAAKKLRNLPDLEREAREAVMRANIGLDTQSQEFYDKVTKYKNAKIFKSVIVDQLTELQKKEAAQLTKQSQQILAEWVGKRLPEADAQERLKVARALMEGPYQPFSAGKAQAMEKQREVWMRRIGEGEDIARIAQEYKRGQDRARANAKVDYILTLLTEGARLNGMAVKNKLRRLAGMRELEEGGLETEGYGDLDESLDTIIRRYGEASEELEKITDEMTRAQAEGRIEELESMIARGDILFERIQRLRERSGLSSHDLNEIIDGNRPMPQNVTGTENAQQTNP